MNKEQQAEISETAKTHLGIDNLEIQSSDETDIHNIPVWQIKMALEKAYLDGFIAGVRNRQ